MATIVTRYVESGIATGLQDGTSEANAWPNLEAAIEGLKLEYASGLPTADVQVDLLCSNPNTINDTSLPVYDIVSDATRFLKIIHSGANDYVVRENAQTDAWLLRGPSSGGGRLEIEGKGKLRFEREFVTNSSSQRGCIESRSMNTVYDGVIFKALNTNIGTGAVVGIRQAFSSTTIRAVNCLFKDFGNSSGGRGIRQEGSSTSAEFYNNTYDNCGRACSAVTGTSRNQLFQNSSVDDHENGITDIDYMLTDGTATGSNSVSSTTLTFVDAANDNYRLAATDTAAIDAGIGPALDANVPTTDVDGTTRSGNDSDIGYAEYVSSGPTITNITNPITTGGTATITGTGFGATQGSSTVTQDGVALTVTNWSDTSIDVTTVDVESSALKYGTHTFEVTIV